MDKKVFNEEFEKAYPNHQQNLNISRELLAAKYGKEEMDKADAVSDIVQQVLGQAMDDLLGGKIE